ncbi:MAG: pectate lyase [Chitinophagaceae bacterium]|nr:pectate lyase [Chitinophagaceae bacterium]
MKLRYIHTCALILFLTTTINAQPLAFPGAEGFGKYTTGGRGGRVYVVTNLEDSGEGSLREAVEAKHPRIVVFAVSGTIHLKSPLQLSKNLTIAGQTAPGDGICLADQPVSLIGDNIIVRYLRFRMGDRYQDKGKVPGSGHDDAFGGNRRKHIIIDHCSMSWSTDEVFSIYDGDSTTLQWNLISEPLNYSYHFEEGDTDYEQHGYGGIWGGKNLSAHHNLFAHCKSRNPRFNGARTFSKTERVDYVNNAIYNWGGNSVYGGEGGEYNMVGNYYKSGPNTIHSVRSRLVNPSKQDKGPIAPGRFFVAANYVYGNKDVSRNNSLGIHFDKKATEEEKAASIQKKSIGEISVPVQTAEEAFNCILKCVGASFPKRDAVDERIINDVKKGTGKIIDVQGGFPHGTSYEISKIAWPELKSTAAPVDSDKDGIPDEWEIKNGLNPADPKDAALFTLDKDYSNIEVYINSLLSDK